VEKELELYIDDTSISRIETGDVKDFLASSFILENIELKCQLSQTNYIPSANVCIRT